MELLLIWLVLYLILIVLLYFAPSNLSRLAFFTGVIGSIVLPGAFFLLLAWILRDGLGPDAVESHGTTALLRFLADVWPGGVLGVIFLVPAYFANRRARRRIAVLEALKPADSSMLGLMEN